MGVGKPRIAACAGPGAPGLALMPLLALTALLASGCARTSPLAAALALGATPVPATATATATVTPQAVPVLGSMSYGTFPASRHGMDALVLCEQWAGLRDEYVGRVRADTPYELEQWFSGPAWRTAFHADK